LPADTLRYGFRLRSAFWCPLRVFRLSPPQRGPPLNPCGSTNKRLSLLGNQKLTTIHSGIILSGRSTILFDKLWLVVVTNRIGGIRTRAQVATNHSLSNTESPNFLRAKKDETGYWN